MNHQNEHHIKSIRVTRLFGRYTYSLPSKGGSLSNLNIVYGENGVGKTTLLNLTFHMLSPANNKGHRSAISRIPFQDLEIILNDGTKLVAAKDAQLLIGAVEFSIESADGEKVRWRLVPSMEDQNIKINDIPETIDLKKLPPDIRQNVQYAIRKRDFFKAIGLLKVDTFMLTADRLLLGDKTEEPKPVDATPDQVKTRNRLAETVRSYRNASVKEALQHASSWLEREFFERGYGGSQYYDPYQEVVLQIASTAYKTRSGLKASEENRIIANLRETITELDQKSKQFSDMGLWGSSISLDLLSVIETTRGNKLNLINAILEPYISGLKARFDKLAPIYELTNRFVTSINQFLRDKQITYSLHEGLKIYTLSTNGRGVDEIDSAQLSSGEQQLILLFCYVLVAQQTPSVIIIDEPEISLNVVWQRRLISSLHDLSTTENIQFIFASHSIELLAKHRNNVVAMQEDIQ